MKCITLSVLFLLIFTSANAQIFNVDPSGKVSPTVTSTKFNSITFIVDKKFKNKKFEIYLADGTTIANTNNATLESDFSRNVNDLNYTITIGQDRKILGCNGCLDVTDDFSVKLDNKVIGSFHLLQLINPDIEKVIPSNEIYYPGSVVNDALFIAAAIGTQTKAGTIKKILESQYRIVNVTDLNTNLFLKTDLQYVYRGTPQGGLSLKGLGSAVGGLDVTNIADGLAKFIVKRTKEELSVAFFQKFKDDLDTYKDLKSLFPQTHGLLMVIDQEIYTYSNYINNLREAFRADINVLDESLPKIVDNHDTFFKLEKNYIFKVSLLSGCYLSSKLKHDVHPGDILQGFPLNYFDGAPTADKSKIEVLKGGIQTIQLFSESLKESNPEKGKYWVDNAKLRELVNNPTAIKIYLGLLLQVAKYKYNDVIYSSSANLYTLLNDQKYVDSFSQDYPKYKQFVISLNGKTEELNKMIKDFDVKVSDSVKVEQYAKYFKATVQLVQSVTEITNLPVFANVTDVNTIVKDSKSYFDVAYQVTDLVSAINRKRYPEAINNVVLIYKTIYVTPVKEQVPTDVKELTKKEKIAIAEKAISAAETDSQQAIGPVLNSDIEITKKINNYPTSKDANYVLTVMAKYGAFMANMIEAKNSNEVAEAIESVALPVGSASIKRKSNFNVSLNAYCGLFTGSEIIKDVDPNKPFKFNSYGVTAPIGISISKGNSIFFIPASKSGFSTSFFISLVDLGAIAAYRFQDTTTEQVPTIKLGDIFSPGLFMSIGIPKTPISVNFGAQTGPNLRKVTSTTNDYSKNTYVRYSVSVCVDIPLLNLYTKSHQ
ncbi:hypothetical protein [Flavobacterium humi]|uniref:Uncharacterized protein n=1 Tax=Flavobacterium humi TaxID=2562683 RepID=A0A4Z0LBG8_9FLAO|nr:hypothetical protein [Flavobacterium humi]TGD59016.1 hypothetical protein E4635_03965 [Flavobacterium humi]